MGGGRRYPLNLGRALLSSSTGSTAPATPCPVEHKDSKVQAIAPTTREAKAKEDSYDNPVAIATATPTTTATATVPPLLPSECKSNVSPSYWDWVLPSGWYEWMTMAIPLTHQIGVFYIPFGWWWTHILWISLVLLYVEQWADKLSDILAEYLPKPLPTLFTYGRFFGSIRFDTFMAIFIMCLCQFVLVAAYEDEAPKTFGSPRHVAWTLWWVCVLFALFQEKDNVYVLLQPLAVRAKTRRQRQEDIKRALADKVAKEYDESTALSAARAAFEKLYGWQSVTHHEYGWSEGSTAKNIDVGRMTKYYRDLIDAWSTQYDDLKRLGVELTDPYHLALQKLPRTIHEHQVSLVLTSNRSRYFHFRQQSSGGMELSIHPTMVSSAAAAIQLFGQVTTLLHLIRSCRLDYRNFTFYAECKQESHVESFIKKTTSFLKFLRKNSRALHYHLLNVNYALMSCDAAKKKAGTEAKECTVVFASSRFYRSESLLAKDGLCRLRVDCPDDVLLHYFKSTYHTTSKIPGATTPTPTPIGCGHAKMAILPIPIPIQMAMNNRLCSCCIKGVSVEKIVVCWPIQNIVVTFSMCEFIMLCYVVVINISVMI